MILYLIKTIPFLRKYYFEHGGRKFARRKLRQIFLHVSPGEKILDIGSGNGLVTSVLREDGYDVTPLDIHEGQYHTSVKPILYDGNKIPFADQSFDTGLLLLILHHTNNQEEIIREAARVCKQLIILEDVYQNSWQKYYVFAVDSLVNLFYSKCPHTNRSEQEWLQLFEGLNLHVKVISRSKLAGVRQVGFLVRQM